MPFPGFRCRGSVTYMTEKPQAPASTSTGTRKIRDLSGPGITTEFGMEGTDL